MPHKNFLTLWWKVNYVNFSLAWKIHKDTRGWLVRWVPRQSLYFILHWLAFVLEGPSNTKCYYFQLFLLFARSLFHPPIDLSTTWSSIKRNQNLTNQQKNYSTTTPVKICYQDRCIYFHQTMGSNLDGPKARKMGQGFQKTWSIKKKHKSLFKGKARNLYNFN